ncbi:hypothetical protein Dimus_026260 [Dionaea muscipula]
MDLSSLVSSVILRPSVADSVFWAGSADGVYTVKLLYSDFFLLRSSRIREISLIWKCVAPPRIQFFGWLGWKGRLKRNLLTIFFFTVISVGRFGAVACFGSIFNGLSRPLSRTFYSGGGN